MWYFGFAGGEEEEVVVVVVEGDSRRWRTVVRRTGA